ncbi:MAG TPA: hypothetical protein VJH23_01540 [archaeon]|nr:hypothetical protein [archaeon]
MYALEYKPEWDRHFSKMDHLVKLQIWKKIQKQKEETQTRHMGFGLEYYVVESGQYRIALAIDEKAKTKAIWFVGDHKQYEKWYKEEA